MDEEKNEEVENDMTGKEMIETQPKGRIAQIIDSIKETFRRMTTPRLGTADDNIRHGAKPLKVQTTNRSFGDMVSGNSLGKRISRFVNESLSNTIRGRAKKDIENSPTTVTTEGKVTHEGSLQHEESKENIASEIVVPGVVSPEKATATKESVSIEEMSVDTNDISYADLEDTLEGSDSPAESGGEETAPVEKDIMSKKDLNIERTKESGPIPDDSFFSSLEEIDEELNGKKDNKDKEEKDENTRD